MYLGNTFITNVKLGANEVYKTYGNEKLVFPSVKFKRDFVLGVNGHQLTQPIYYNTPTTNFEWQINQMVEMGITWARLDVIASTTGEILNTSGVGYRLGRIFGTSPADIGNPSDPLLAVNFGFYHKCQAAGIQVLPMLAVRAGGTVDGNGNSNDDEWIALYPTPQDAYDAGFLAASSFITNYGPYFTHLELGNELELFTNLLSGGQGALESNYKTEKLLKAVQYIAGMEAGAKSVKPELITMFNIAGWLAVYLLDQVLAAAPTINKIGWHWYSSMQGNIKNSNSANRLPNDGKTPTANTYTDIPSYQANRYPDYGIWFTEMGTQYNTNGELINQKRMIDVFNSMLTDFLPADNIEMMFFHELIDMSSSGSFIEKHYGLIDRTDPANPKEKILCEALKNKPV